MKLCEKCGLPIQLDETCDCELIEVKFCKISLSASKQKLIKLENLMKQLEINYNMEEFEI